MFNFTVVPALKPPRSSAAAVPDGCPVVVRGTVVVAPVTAVVLTAGVVVIVVVLPGDAVVVPLVGGRQESRLGYCGPDQQLAQLV